jgi:nucleotide-binding universal stress UspA family protein
MRRASRVVRRPVHLGQSMHGFVLVVTNEPETAHACLDAAGQIADAFNEARIEVTYIRVDPATMLTSEEVLTRERQAQLESTANERATAVNRIYEAWRHENYDGGAGRTVWSTPVGTVRDQVRLRGRGADLIVLAPPRSLRDLYGREALKAAIFEAERPVLVVSGTIPSTIGQSIAILWDDEPPTVKAVLDAMPLLARAERVFVLIPPARDTLRQELPTLFIDHGVDAEIHAIEAVSRPPGRALLDQAHRLGADLLVVGAYARHPLTELLLGGVTRYVVAHADLPVLMRH